MTITSTAFQPNEPLPDKHSYDGGNVNPPLTFSEVPVEAKSLVLTMEDPDAPGGTWTHWILYNMSPATLQILENSVPDTAEVGLNDFGTTAYGGPKPPSGTHRYIFTLFALDKTLDFKQPPKRGELYREMIGHDIVQAQLIGNYSH